MKHLKKTASLLLIAVMVLVMCVPVMAYTITAPKNGHTYEVYQIFTGSLSADNVLSNITWGSSAKNNDQEAPVGEAVPNSVLTELETISKSASDTEKLNVILKYANLSKVYNPIVGTSDQNAENPKLENVPAD